MMQQKSIILSALIGMLLLTACESFLEREPLDQIITDNFYQNVDEVNLALVGSYAPMLDIDWTGKGWMITEIPSDNSMPGGTDPDFSPIDNFTVTADNLIVGNYWARHYQQVTYANTVLAKLEESPIDKAEQAPLAAEAKFLRAVAYFDLVRIFGGVPLITEPPVFGEDLLFPRATVAEVYDLIKADFTEAAEHLPLERSGQNNGRATKGAALAFLAKAHLTRREYVMAKDAAKAVIDLGVYQLMPDYAANFELETTDNNIESIFQVQYAGCGPFNTGNPMQAFFAPWGEGITKDRDGWGSHIPTGPVVATPNTTIMDAFEEGDLRKKWTVMTSNEHYESINADDGGYTYPAAGASASAGNIKKYVVGSGPDICFMSTPQNAHVIRYADMLLTYAECIMEIEGGVSSNGEALDAFNAVRTRAGLEPLTMIDKEIMLHERRVEFGFEGHRWFDLLRSGRAIEILSIHGKNPALHNLLFPIPSGEIQINPNLTQNPGY
ncbi:MAG: RagB/SusD family nutrient uptake outer membrane protein [Bacteroidota bacterium]